MILCESWTTRTAIVVAAVAAIGCTGKPVSFDSTVEIGAADGPTVVSDWVRVEPGSFTMGFVTSHPCWANAPMPRPIVTLTRPFLIKRTEVTQAEYRSLMGFLPESPAPCSRCPVGHTSWNLAARYCNALSERQGLTSCYRCTDVNDSGVPGSRVCRTAPPFLSSTGGSIHGCSGFRLPTEAEWEYAYRAGTSSDLYNGEFDIEQPAQCAGASKNVDRIGWYDKNSGWRAHEVARKEPNSWGIYDMAGNAVEWTHDVGGSLPATNTIDPVLDTADRYDPGGLTIRRVLKGGSYNRPAWYVVAGWRFGELADYEHGETVGFRCIRTLPSP